MGQSGRVADAVHQDLRGEIIRLLRAGLAVDRGALAAQFGVSQRTVTAIRGDVEPVLAAATARDGANRRTVQNFDGKKLRHLRCGGAPGGVWYTQEQLGKLADRSRGEVGHLENNHRKPTIVTMNAIADALGVHPSELLLDEENSSYEQARHGAPGLGRYHYPATA